MSNPLKHSRSLILSELDGHFVRKEFIRPVSWAAALCLVFLSLIARAQSPTSTLLSATPSGTVSGSIVTMTANVSSSGQPVTGGTVTFRDTFSGAAQDLGTIQVQSANGVAGTAILATEVGGVGPHSIVAIYNAPKAYSASTSAPVALTFSSPYSSATAVAITGNGTPGSYTLTGTLSGFGPMQPSGALTFTDTTTNTTIGTVPLDSTTAVQGFTPPALYQIPTSVPWTTSSMGTPASGDFNGDGRPDFAIATSLGPVVIMLGHGDGTFQQGTSLSATTPFGVVVGDFNGDGKQDLAVANKGTNSSIAIYLGNGDGTFQAGAVYPAASGSNYQILAMADFDGDGNQDLVVSDSAHDQVAVLLGVGDGTFLPAGLFSTGHIPWNIAIGDVNSDGNPDIVVADDGDSSITLLLGNGDGTFQKGVFPTGGATSSGSVALADFNGDGKLDIAVTEQPANTVFILLGNGDGTFGAETAYPMNTGPYYLTIGDFNQDGKKDIITANADGVNGTVGVLLGNGDGTFQSAKTYPAAGATIYATVQDFNGDNQVDVVAVTSQGLEVFLAGNAQSAQFSPFIVNNCDTQSIVATYSGDTNYATSISPVASVSQSGLATSISVAQTPQNAVYGQPVTLTATLTPYANGSFSSDGTNITFFDGSASLGMSQLSSGVASLPITPSTGPHSFTAVYGGACALTGSTSLADVATVGKATPTITWANPGPIVYGATLSSAQLNATASVPGTSSSLPGTLIYSPALGATLPAGTDTLSVSFTPNDSVNYATTTSTVPITVSPAVLTVTAQDATRPYGAADPTFSGKITGALNSDTFSESFISSATATSVPGTYAIVPSATGPNLADYTQSVTNGTLTITQAASTSSIISSATAISPGQNVTFTAHVVSATSGTPTGTVSFSNNGSLLGTATLTNGTAMYSTTTLALGNNVITANYIGDGNFTPSAADSVSVNVALNVLTITADDSVKIYGAANPVFTGKITGAQNGDTFTESFSTAATLTSAPGTYAIVPSATGTDLAQYTQSVENGTLTIAKASVVSSIALSATTITQGQNVDLTANVASATSGTPTGTVSFFNNGSLLGTVTLTNGKATYSTTTLPVGNNVITFTYGGDANFTANTAASSTGTNTVIVSAPAPLDFSFQMTTPSSGLSGNYGGSVPITLHVAPTAGQFPGTVQFAVTGTPAVSATYTFSPATLAVGSGAADVTMTIQFQALTSQNHVPMKSHGLASIAFGLLFLPWLSLQGIRRSGRQLGKSLSMSALFLVVLGAAMTITGCGSSTPASVAPVNNPVSDAIVVTATSGSVQHSVTVNLSVQKAQ